MSSQGHPSHLSTTKHSCCHCLAVTYTLLLARSQVKALLEIQDLARLGASVCVPSLAVPETHGVSKMQNSRTALIGRGEHSPGIFWNSRDSLIFPSRPRGSGTWRRTVTVTGAGPALRLRAEVWFGAPRRAEICGDGAERPVGCFPRRGGGGMVSRPGRGSR